MASLRSPVPTPEEEPDSNSPEALVRLHKPEDSDKPPKPVRFLGPKRKVKFVLRKTRATAIRLRRVLSPKRMLHKFKTIKQRLQTLAKLRTTVKRLQEMNARLRLSNSGNRGPNLNHLRLENGPRDATGQAPLANFGNLSINQTDAFFDMGALVVRDAEKLTADLYITNEPATLIPAIGLKRQQGAGRVVWYVKEHFSFQRRTLAYAHWNDVNATLWTQLDALIESACSDLDGAVCTGEGYRQMMSDLGVESVDLGRRILTPSQFAEAEVPATIANGFAEIRQKAGKLIVYPSTLYKTSDFGTVMRALSHLPDDYHLVHLGVRRTESWQTADEFDAQSLGVADRLHFLGDLPFDAYLKLMSQCDVGLVHLTPTVESSRLSFHNRFSDLISARIPFAYSENVSATGVEAIRQACAEYNWQNPESMANAIRELAETSTPPDYETALKSTNGAYSSGAERSQFLREYVRTLNVDSVTFLGTANLCENQPTLELARAFVAEDVAVKFYSCKPLEWTDEQDCIPEIQLVN